MPSESSDGREKTGRIFSRQWYRSAIPGLIAVSLCGLLTSRTPETLWLAVGIACVGVVASLLSHGGLIVSPDGLAWYIFRPQWRYRVVPWTAVLEVRKTFGVLEPIRLDVRQDRYEPWVWDEPQSNRVLTLEVWSNGYAGGSELWETIRANCPVGVRPTVAR